MTRYMISSCGSLETFEGIRKFEVRSKVRKGSKIRNIRSPRARKDRKMPSNFLRKIFEENNIVSTCFEGGRREIEKFLRKKVFHRFTVGRLFRSGILFSKIRRISKKRMLKQHCSKEIEFRKLRTKSKGSLILMV